MSLTLSLMKITEKKSVIDLCSLASLMEGPFHQGMSTLTVLHSKICEDKDAPVHWQGGKQQPQPAHARETNLPTKKTKTSRYIYHMNGRPSKGIFVLHKDRHSSLISGLYAAAHTLKSPVSIFAHGLIQRIKDAAIVKKKSIRGGGANTVRFPINKLIYTTMFHYFRVETVNSCSSLLLVGYIPTAWGLSWEAAEELDKKDHILQSCRCQTHAPSHKFPIFTELPEKSTTFGQPQSMNKLKNPI